MSRPSVAAVIPVLNGEAHISAAIDSILEQTRPVDDLVVIDDGSTDGTAKLVSSYGAPVRVISTPPSGVSAARNRGVRETDAELIAFLDADDVWPASRIEAHVDRFVAAPELDIVIGRVRYVGLEAEELRKYRFSDERHEGLVPNLGAITIRRRVFDQHGYLDEALRRFEDWDWFFNARDRGAKLGVIDHVSLEYRRRPGSASQRDEPADLGMPELIKRSLDRRRALQRLQRELPTLEDLKE